MSRSADNSRMSATPYTRPHNPIVRHRHRPPVRARASASSSHSAGHLIEEDELDSDLTDEDLYDTPSRRVGGSARQRVSSRPTSSSSLSPSPSLPLSAQARLRGMRVKAEPNHDGVEEQDDGEEAMEIDDEEGQGDNLPPQPHDSPPPPPPSSGPTRIDRSRLAARRPGAGVLINIPDSPPGRSGASSTSALSSAGGSPTTPVPSSHRPQTRAPQSSDSSIRALDDDEVAALTTNGAGRRYTAAEKGKGRAVVSSESIVVEGEKGKGKGKKRKSGDVGSGDEDERNVKRTPGGKIRSDGRSIGWEDGEVDELDLIDVHDKEGVDELEESDVEEGEFLDEFSCPVCFCSLSRPVATLCGHILCSDCLHSSLLAAIGRNPNPLPAHLHALHHAGPAPRAPPRAPRVNHTRAKAKSDPAHNPPPESIDAQPVEWTLAALQAKVVMERKREREELERAAELQFEAAELPKESWEAAKLGLGLIGEEADGDGEGRVLAVEVLKGLWRIPGGTVIEGECPVCRNAIPGGMGPFGSGIGSITPLYAVVKG